jgi:hypothetical protein
MYKHQVPAATEIANKYQNSTPNLRELSTNEFGKNLKHPVFYLRLR